ncbi:uncharacterized protein HMPREF1541_07688 [Cyphellophora europaea CBS 101466]|uniref:RING-type domain-containing protein n=1 Tax=Cyphellophora europaea (strain CBS 101466) TaxID=1220924 RepID=W2RQR8_CYPE1|nr:uncharacterized protein HMPREF1541_07688 [Cyphellophora europaea CBS 101466]ETN38064.1 hypothetical protein HMPREF1541_07688 [Cyphellophora europaea CBS 101466]
MRANAVAGAIFFQPDSSGGRPPSVNDPIWSLNDGGRWQGENQFPIYALPGPTGAFLLQQSALYSGNMTSAPFGEELAQQFNDQDLIRLVVRVDVSGSPGIPSLWVFLIIVLAVLLAIVLTTSVVMHLVQRRQRRRLTERVARGEVDLEALGIKRLNVPQSVLDTMPTFTYTSKETTSVSDPNAATDATTPASPTAPIREIPYSQNTCPICLDDFVHGTTIVRELPCAHIFHPECIDPFLRDNSSLCPMCKKSSLPAGYCPVNVTNIMVRRERLVRRMRARASGEEGLVRQIDAESGHGLLNYNLGRLRDRVAGRRAASAGLHSSRVNNSHGASNAGAAEMANINVVQPPARAQTAPPADGEPVRERQSANAEPEEVPEEIRAQGTTARRAWLRERFARREQRQYEEGAAQARAADEGRSACKCFCFSSLFVFVSITDLLAQGVER